MPKTSLQTPAPASVQTPCIDSRYASFQLSVRPSAIHRWGVYAEQFIPYGHKVIEYTGERCNRRETAKRAARPLNYMFTINSYWALDGSVGGSGAEFINHSCDPNIRSWICKGHILYMAARDIQPGEELTVDYHFEAEVEEVICACGAANCRGTINVKPEPKSSGRARQRPEGGSARRRRASASNRRQPPVRGA